MANQSKTMTMSCQQPQPFGSSPLGSVSPGGSSIIGGAGGGGGGGIGIGPDGKLAAGYYGGSQHSLPGLTQPPRQKGRPRKRKPKDLEAMTANLGEFKSDIFYFFLFVSGMIILLIGLWFPIPIALSVGLNRRMMIFITFSSGSPVARCLVIIVY